MLETHILARLISWKSWCAPHRWQFSIVRSPARHAQIARMLC